MKTIDKINLFVLISLIMPILVFSQKGEYTVLTISGNVMLLNKDLEEVANINLGDKLYQNDNLILKKGGYIVLMDSELQSVELSNSRYI